MPRPSTFPSGRSSLFALLVLPAWLLVSATVPPAAVASAAVAGAGHSPAADGERAGKSGPDACALLSPSDIASLQGAPLVQAKPHVVLQEGFRIAQCFYETAEFPRSVSVLLTRPEMPGGVRGSARARFQEFFHRGASREDKEERAESEEEERPPQRVVGVGDEAWWTGNAQVGALYVLKGDAFLRISVGGGEPEGARIERSRLLARRALRRL